MPTSIGMMALPAAILNLALKEWSCGSAMLVQQTGRRAELSSTTKPARSGRDAYLIGYCSLFYRSRTCPSRESGAPREIGCGLDHSGQKSFATAFVIPLHCHAKQDVTRLHPPTSSL